MGTTSSCDHGHGPQFRSHDFATFLSSKGIQHSRTAVYHPQSNGGVERFNQVIKPFTFSFNGRFEFPPITVGNLG